VFVIFSGYCGGCYGGVEVGHGDAAAEALDGLGENALCSRSISEMMVEVIGHGDG